MGASEEAVRALFKEAEAEQAEKGDDSELHIIILDEMDAILRSRGSTSGGTGVNDSVVNQFLSKIDGVEALNNILLIGMTNRKDMIDEAILRPGRLEIHVEIGLPDEPGRVQVLGIHTKALRANGMLADDVSVEDIAARAKNYTGAEMEGLVKAACSFLFARTADPSIPTRRSTLAPQRSRMRTFYARWPSTSPRLARARRSWRSSWSRAWWTLERSSPRCATRP